MYPLSFDSRNRLPPTGGTYRFRAKHRAITTLAEIVAVFTRIFVRSLQWPESPYAACGWGEYAERDPAEGLSSTDNRSSNVFSTVLKFACGSGYLHTADVSSFCSAP